MIGALLLGALLRLVALDRVPPGLSHDEAYNGITALEVWLLGRRDIFFDIYNGIEPLIVYWEAVYFQLFGITPLAMRLVNVTAGMLTIPLTYALARRLVKDSPDESPVPLLAALGVSLSFWAVFVSRLTLRAVTLPLLELPALYCLWRGLTAGESTFLTCHSEERSDEESLKRSAAQPEPQGFSPALALRASASASVAPLRSAQNDMYGRSANLPRCVLRPRRSNWPAPLYFVLGGALLGAAMYTYLSSRFLPLVPLLLFGYWLLRGQMRRAHWLGLALFFGAWALVFAPLGLYYLQHLDIFTRRADQVLTLPPALAGNPLPLITSTLRTLGMFSLVGADTSRYGLAGRPLFDPLGAIFFHVGLIASLVRLRRPARQAAPYAFLLIWWLVMLAPAFITGEAPHFLRTIGALPPTYIFWALGIATAGRWLASLLSVLTDASKVRRADLTGFSKPVRSYRRWAMPALAAYLAAAGALTVYDYFGRWASDAEARTIYGAEFTEVAQYLQTAKPKGPIVLSAAYYRDWDRFRLDLQMHHNPPFVVWFNGPQTFLLPPPGSSMNPAYIFTRSAPPDARWLDFLQLEAQGTDMAVYRLKAGARVKLDVPLNATVYDAPGGAPTAQLLGYRLDGQAQAGETLRLLLHWQPLRDVPGDPDYAFFVHLRDRRGTSWAQADANGYAVVDWQPGVQVLQWFDLRLSPDLPLLDYTLVAGLEDRGAGRPLPVALGAAKEATETAVELQTVTPAIAAGPPPDSFGVPNRSAIDAGGIFTLRGHSLSARFVPPGGSTQVSLFWQAGTAPGADYSLALWLNSPAGERIDLGQRQPLEGDYPTSRWAAGQWVRDRFRLTLPTGLPSGVYRLFAGWRDPSGQWVATGDGPGIPLGTIFITTE
jgi:hypothetical protein